MIHTYRHFIGGQWHAPSGGQWIESVDPATAAVWARIPRGNRADATLAVESAHAAFCQPSWGTGSREQRCQSLLDLADTLEQRWPELVEAEIRDNGKRIVEVEAQCRGLHTWYRYFARQVLTIDPHPLDNQVPDITNTAHYHPYGVVIAITPWNSPLMIAAWKMAPALAAGNTIVIKPSEHASASTLEFARLCQASALPAGVVNVVTGWGHEVGEALVRHPLARKVTFTGSEAGGSRVAAVAADSVLPVTLELGGKSSQLLFADADLDSAINGILAGIFLSNGQTCVAGSRLIVEKSIHREVVERIVQRARALRAGDPLNPATEIAPLANAAHLDKVLSMIAEAKAQGARCVCGGERIYPRDRPDGYYVAPTVFDPVSPQMSLWNEEVFGPVLAVAEFDSEEQALRMANETRYGLAAGVWTGNPQVADRMAAGLDVGTVYVNHYRSVSPGSPIGGVKRSGYGRELGPDAIKDFLQVKSVWKGVASYPDPFPVQG